MLNFVIYAENGSLDFEVSNDTETANEFLFHFFNIVAGQHKTTLLTG